MGPENLGFSRKHYTDGWGESHGIHDHGTLIDVVHDEGSGEPGKLAISQGTWQNREEPISKYCKVVYENKTGTKGDDLSISCPCGPSNGD